MRYNLNVETRGFLRYFLIIVILLMSMITGAVYLIQKSNLESVFKAYETTHVELWSKTMSTDFNTALSALVFLSEQHELKSVSDGDENDKKRLLELFLTLSRRLGLFDQVRLIT